MVPVLKRLLPACMLAALLLNACGSGNTNSSSSSGGHLVIAEKNFTEGELLGNLTQILLQHHGFTVTLKEINGNTAIRNGLTEGQYDGYWEYTGTDLVDYLNQAPIGNPNVACQKSKQLDAKNNIIWLTPCAPMNDQDVLLIRDADVSTYGSTLSDLAAYTKSHPSIRYCLQAEFLTRPSGLPALKSTYGLEPHTLKTISEGISFTALQNNQCDVAQGFGTDGRIPEFHLHVMVDDKFALPSDNAALIVRKSTYNKYPQLKTIMAKLSPLLTTSVMTQLNAHVDVDKQDPATVAQNFLKQHGLI